MQPSTQIQAALNYLYLSATRGSLEGDTSWYYRAIGKSGYETRANRTVLEEITFIQLVLGIDRFGVYQLSLGGTVYKQHYMSGAEIIRYILKNCHVDVSKNFNGLVNTKTGEQLDIRFVARDNHPARR
jgi:hypothetical protein